MSRTQLAILPASLAAFWLGKIGVFLGVDSIITYGVICILIAINLYIEISNSKNATGNSRITNPGQTNPPP